jgi:hypothetical protein
MSSRILLIMPVFYGVETNVKLTLEKLGYEVVWIENKNLTFDYHGTKAKLKILRRIFFSLFSPQSNYLKVQFKKIGDIRFDVLFAINGHVICPFLFKELRKQNPSVKSILFLWDSFSMYRWTKEISYFDKVFTFDPTDSKKYDIEYKPNFYLKNGKLSGTSEKYDLFFTGKFSQDRYLIVDQIVNYLNNTDTRYFIRLWPSYKILFHNKFFYLIFKKSPLKTKWLSNYVINYEVIEGNLVRNFLIRNCLSYEESQQKLLSSNVILDLPNREQSGFTHRIIEALANGKKILTTNRNIEKESFYSSEQIRFIGEQNPEIDLKWIKEKTTFPVSDYFDELEISLWLNSILNVETA